MKKYVEPKIEALEVKASDIITSSPGTETPKLEENDGLWDLSIG